MGFRVHGNQKQFSDTSIFVNVFTYCSTYTLILPIHRIQPLPLPQTATIFHLQLFFILIPNLTSATLVPIPVYQVSLSLNISVPPCTDLTTFLLLFLAPVSFHSLASFLLNQLNCHASHPSTCLQLYLPFPSCFCSAIIAPCLNQLYHAHWVYLPYHSHIHI